MEIVINDCYGGYSLSQEAQDWLVAKGHPVALKLREEAVSGRYVSIYGLGTEIARNDPLLVACVKELGSDRASGPFAELKVVEVPDNRKKWQVDEYDGYESIDYRQTNGVKLLSNKALDKMKAILGGDRVQE